MNNLLKNFSNKFVKNFFEYLGIFCASMATSCSNNGINKVNRGNEKSSKEHIWKLEKNEDELEDSKEMDGRGGEKGSNDSVSSETEMTEKEWEKQVEIYKDVDRRIVELNKHLKIFEEIMHRFRKNTDSFVSHFEDISSYFFYYWNEIW